MSAAQEELFPQEKRLTYGEMTRNRKRDLARSDLVKDEVLAVFRAKAGEWISGAWTDKDLDRIEKKHDLGAYFYDAIHALHREGKLESRNVYHGAKSPVSASSDLAGRKKLKKDEKAPDPYLGYHVEYRYVEKQA